LVYYRETREECFARKLREIKRYKEYGVSKLLFFKCTLFISHQVKDFVISTPEVNQKYLASLPEPTEEELAYFTVLEDYAEEESTENNENNK
jgi:hypothetical protein